MVEQLEDIKGYLELSQIDKVKYAVALKAYLDNVKKDDLEDMDILKVIKHSFKKNAYTTIFIIGNSELRILIKFKKSMLLVGK